MTKNLKRPLLAGAAIAAVAAAGAFSVAGPATAQSENAATSLRAELLPLNNSGASGMVELRLSGNGKNLNVHITASGLEAGGVHVSHIHGRSENGAPVDSSCPTIADDTDGDTFVELGEGVPRYGPVLIDFMNVDPDKDGKVDFRTVVKNPDSKGALPLTSRHVVIHGLSVGAVGAGTPGEVNGTADYKTVLPVLCGELVANGTSSSTSPRIVTPRRN